MEGGEFWLHFHLLKYRRWFAGAGGGASLRRCGGKSWKELNEASRQKGQVTSGAIAWMVAAVVCVEAQPGQVIKILAGHTALVTVLVFLSPSQRQ